MIKATHGRKDRLIKERKHDTYLKQSKLRESTVCETCGAVFSNGRWTWKNRPEKSHVSVCPACRRRSDNYPAGRIELSGLFFQDNKKEIINLIQNIENQEKKEHPMERIMTIKSDRTTTVITTTGIHIARRIGEALSRAYKGDYSFHYADGQDLIHVTWNR